jgi:hypothetical protein
MSYEELAKYNIRVIHHNVDYIHLIYIIVSKVKGSQPYIHCILRLRRRETVLYFPNYKPDAKFKANNLFPKVKSKSQPLNIINPED